MDNRDLFLAVLEAGRSQVKMPADLVSAKNPLPGSQAEGGSKSSWDFCKGANPIHEGSTQSTSSNPSYLPKTSPSVSSH